MFPHGVVTGDTFSKNLPHPARLHRTARRARFNAEHAATRRKIISAMLTALGAKPEGVRHRENGALSWPTGLTGSLAHKGTMIVGVGAKLTKYKAVGIDLELSERNDGELRAVDNMESPDLITGIEPTLASFSIKEAVYKADSTNFGTDLDFQEIEINWDGRLQPAWGGSARTSSGRQYQVQGSKVGKWVISGAHHS